MSLAPRGEDRGSPPPDYEETMRLARRTCTQAGLNEERLLGRLQLEEESDLEETYDRQAEGGPQDDEEETEQEDDGEDEGEYKEDDWEDEETECEKEDEDYEGEGDEDYEGEEDEDEDYEGDEDEDYEWVQVRAPRQAWQAPGRMIWVRRKKGEVFSD